EEILRTVVYMAHNRPMNVVLYCRILIAIAGLTLSFSIPLFRKKFVAHRSLVMLLTLHCGWNLMFSAFALIDTMITAYTYATWKRPEDLASFNDGRSCFHRKIYAIYAVYGTITSMYAITIESASILYKTYERSGYCLGYALSFGQFILASVFLTGTIRNFDLSETRVHCVVASKVDTKFQRPLAITIFIFEIICLITFRALLHLNKQRLILHNHGLSEKYQIIENIRTLKLLVPVVASHITLTSILAGSVAVLLSIHMEPQNKAIAEECLGFLHLQSIMVPLFILVRHWNNSEVRKELTRIIRLNSSARISEQDRVIMKDW
ncbi:hypothetical protein PENTCL1PPCAC_21969, partial [Pristionchus entomophagus]